MKILILTNHLNIGGITRYILNLSLGLKQRGHKVFVGSLPGWAQEVLKQEGIDFLRLPIKTKSILSPQLIQAYFILRKFINSQGIDIIHAQTRITQFLAFLLSKTLNIAYVCTFHGFYRPHLARKSLPCLGDITIAISQAVGNHLIKDFNLNKENLRVVYNAIDIDRTSLTGKDYTQLKGAPTLGIISRLSSEKGHLLLFNVFKQLVRDYPQIRLLVVGSGKKERELKDWVRRHECDNQIVFLGTIPNLTSLFRVLDISILPSTQEGLGFAILEAQAYGVPVVATCVGGISEIIKDRQTGILVEPGNTQQLYKGIKLILDNVSLRETIINNARQQIRDRFNLQKMVSEVESIYKQTIERK